MSKKYGKVLNIWKKVVSLHMLINKGNKNMESKSFRQQIIDLEKGEHITISVDVVGYTTIRSYASDLGFAYNRKYSATRNRTNRTYTITRIQ